MAAYASARLIVHLGRDALGLRPRVRRGLWGPQRAPAGRVPAYAAYASARLGPASLICSGLGPAVLLLFAAIGCALFRPTPLEVPPGHGVVVGRVELVGFPVADAALDILKDDGTFSDVVLAGVGHRDFALVLPRGRYRITQLRVMRDVGEGDQATWPLRLTFEVGTEPAAYIGTLRLSATFGQAIRVSVADEYEDTLRAVRALYTGLPEPVARRLLTPA